jgi:hypothetical protein
MTQNNATENTYLIRYLQFFIVILFIALNTTLPFIRNTPLDEKYLQIFSGIADMCLIPLFVFATALSLNHTRYKTTFSNFFEKRILDVLILYLIGIFIILPITSYYTNYQSQAFTDYISIYSFWTSSPGPLWVFPFIMCCDILFFFILNKYNFSHFIKKLEDIEKTKVFVLMFLMMFFAYMIPYAIANNETFVTAPLNDADWYSIGIIWLPKTKTILLLSIYCLGVIIANSEKLFKYTLSSHNKLSETYIYKIIESIILYILLSTLNDKASIHPERIFEFLHTLLFLLLMISTSMAIIGIFNKLCTKQSSILDYFSKYNYFIYAVNTLPILLLQRLFSQYPQLVSMQKIYIITLFSVVLSYAAGLIIRRIAFIKRIIPNSRY